jgi:hypothetical protein
LPACYNPEAALELCLLIGILTLQDGSTRKRPVTAAAKLKEAYVNRINHTSARRVAGNAVIALAAAALLANGLPAQAQQTEVEALRAQIEELSQRLEKLETSQVATAEAAKSTPPVTARSAVSLSACCRCTA